MEVKEILVKFCSFLNKHNFLYVIVGGIAAILFGVRRTTMDIDVIINIKNKEELLKLCDFLREINFYTPKEWALSAFEEKTHFTIFTGGFVHIDVKFPITDLDFSTLKRRIRIYIDNTPVFVSPLEELIASKLCLLQSLKDIEDALQLMYIHLNRIDWKYLFTLVGRDPLVYANRILDDILREFKDNKDVIARIKRAKSLKSKIEETLEH